MIVIVGTGRWGGTEGQLHSFRLDDAAGAFAPVSTLEAGSLSSFLAVDRARRLVHVADEEARGVRSFSVGEDGTLGYRGDVPTAGHPVSIHLGDAAMYVASYVEGLVERLPLGSDGLPGAPTAQASPGEKAHCASGSPFADTVLVTSTGSDRVVAYTPQLEPEHVLEVPGGPRHLAWHPALPLVYAVTEYTEELVVLEHAYGVLTERARQSLRPPGWEGTGADVHVHAGGELLVATLRHPDEEGQLATVGLDAEGMPTATTHQPSGGLVPRNATLAGDLLLVTHRVSGELQAFSRAGEGWARGSSTTLASPFCVRTLP
ncbi:MAG: beta-propeller fold lactonase family protein [Myxococcota bacterium]